MSAPLGNKFWQARSSHGRKPTFPDPETLWDACVEYFEWVEANPLYEERAFPYQGVVTRENMTKMRAMTIGALCLFLDIDQTTWGLYRAREDFRGIVSRVEATIRAQKFEGAAAELLNPNIIARDLGLSDKTEFTGKDGGPVKTETTTVTDPMAGLDPSVWTEAEWELHRDMIARAEAAYAAKRSGAAP